jgi:hypothetical protein
MKLPGKILMPCKNQITPTMIKKTPIILRIIFNSYPFYNYFTNPADWAGYVDAEDSASITLG